MDKKEVGYNVKKARELKSQNLGYRYTQLQLAKDISSSQGYISDIESGRAYPSTPAVNAIAKACGVSVGFIFGNEKSIGTSNPDALNKLKETFSQVFDIVYLPVYGNIAAGQPIDAEENVETYLPYPRTYSPEKHFVLRVQGESMRDAGILNNDLVVIRKQETAENGQIVAVRIIDDGVTLKRFYRTQNKVILTPCNSDFQPMELTDNLEIVGIAVSITKNLI